MNQVQVNSNHEYKNDSSILDRGIVLFLILTFSQIFLIILIYFNVYISILAIFELIFFLVTVKNSFKQIKKIFLLTIIIFLVNSLFQEGEVIAKFFFILITREGLIESVKRSMLLFILILHTKNTVGQKKEIIIHSLLHKKKNLFIESVFIFFELFNNITTQIRIKYLYRDIIKVYKSTANTNGLSSNKSASEPSDLNFFSRSYIVFITLFYILFCIAFFAQYIFAKILIII